MQLFIFSLFLPSLLLSGFAFDSGWPSLLSVLSLVCFLSVLVYYYCYYLAFLLIDILWVSVFSVFPALDIEEKKMGVAENEHVLDHGGFVVPHTNSFGHTFRFWFSLILIFISFLHFHYQHISLCDPSEKFQFLPLIVWSHGKKFQFSPMFGCYLVILSGSHYNQMNVNNKLGIMMRRANGRRVWRNSTELITLTRLLIL